MNSHIRRGQERATPQRGPDCSFDTGGRTMDFSPRLLAEHHARTHQHSRLRPRAAADLHLQRPLTSTAAPAIRSTQARAGRPLTSPTTSPQPCLEVAPARSGLRSQTFPFLCLCDGGRSPNPGYGCRALQGDDEAEQRAQVVWGRGDPAELTQALMGLRARGWRNRSSRHTLGPRWLRAFGHLRISENSTSGDNNKDKEG
ncbi:hypothetical protein AALO_G00229920 [Alosa alosa]|uniref:Arginine vasopressin-induced protein 1 n=1 Tax=Alosa alosa TaxID=278164 RepID=A0AAV6FUB2_9TELE|nr:hypothetical protein AALO_G00229920 [Alosa alosa]